MPSQTMGWRGASALPGFVFGGLLVLSGWRFLVIPSIAVEDEGIAVQNPFSRGVVPWNDVVEVVPGYSGLVIRRRSGPPTVAWAVQKANAATWLKKRTRAEEVAETLMEVVQSHQRSSSSGLALPG
jgi:hypothetical protein